MSVIVSPDCFDHPGPDDRCTVCAGRLFPPLIVWRAEGMIYICGPCTERNGVGLIADLIQVQAIRDIQRLFPDYTLIRQHLPSHSRHLRTVFGAKP